MQEKQNSTGLIWFKNDLRTQDNCVLSSCVENHSRVIAVYCFDPRHFEIDKFGFKKTEKFRAKFLIETINQLKQNLKLLNIELFVYLKKPEVVINKLVETFSVTAIYCQKEWTTEEQIVNAKVKASIPKNVVLQTFYNQFLYHPSSLGLTVEKIPKVFTHFRKHVEKQCLVEKHIDTPPAKSITGIINKTKIPTLEQLGFKEFENHPNSAFPFKGGETWALERLNTYIFETKKLGVYKKTRNGLVGTDYSSKFSPWLANGSISAKTIYWKVKQFEKEFYKNQSTYWLVFELIWRDFFKYIALKHGASIFKTGGILNRKYQWKTDARLIQKWIDGKTASAFVNANMIELKKTGWMSNRGRQNVASYFAKDLLLDWRIGTAYFESLLIDYDVHSNYGNWMYVAGVGNDPRDRKFNVASQAERYDPNGKFQNLWLQETLF